MSGQSDSIRSGPWDLFADRSASDPRPGDEIAEILVVCTANICRSPLVMAMLEDESRRRIGPEAPVWVRSSGINGLEGEPAAERTRVEASDRGLDLSRHRAAITTREEVSSCDLVIVMSERHRSRVVRLHPPAVRYTFTLPELDRLCSALKPIEDPDLAPRERIRFVAQLAHGSRAYVERPGGPENVADPFGGPDEGYALMATIVERHVRSLAPQLFGWMPQDAR